MARLTEHCKKAAAALSLLIVKKPRKSSACMASARPAVSGLNSWIHGFFPLTANSACPKCGGLGMLGHPEAEDVTSHRVCPKCNGSRLKPQALAVKIGEYSIWDLVQRPAEEVYQIIKRFKFSSHEKAIADPVVAELLTRLSLLNQLGLSYLSLGRSGETLSGGEAQRVRLAAQLDSKSHR